MRAKSEFVSTRGNINWLLMDYQSFGKDSDYWTDDSGIHFHFGSKDNALLEMMGDSYVGLVFAEFLQF